MLGEMLLNIFVLVKVKKTVKNVPTGEIFRNMLM